MRRISIATLVLALATPALAQQVQLEFRDGRVTLDAAAVPVRTILAEWARLGGTNVVNGDKVAGAPVTLRLEGVPEAQALEVILRGVAGYMAAPRQDGSAGASSYDRILVMPTSTAPPPTAAARTTSGPAAVRGPRVPFQPGDRQDEAPQVEQDVNEPPPAFQFPEQNPFQPFGQPNSFGAPVSPASGQPVFQFTPGQTGASGVSVNPAPPQQMPVMQFPGVPQGGSSGFGAVGAPTPGVIIQPPTPQPGQRPPGGQ